MPDVDVYPILLFSRLHISTFFNVWNEQSGKRNFSEYFGMLFWDILLVGGMIFVGSIRVKKTNSQALV